MSRSDWSFDLSASISNDFDYDIGRGPYNDGWGNWELQTYTNDEQNVKVQDNQLVISAIKISDDLTYTSGRIKTKNKIHFTYGTVEIVAKVTTTSDSPSGAWAAFWMLGKEEKADGTVDVWPHNGEIDIMEWIGRSPKYCFGTLHTAEHNGGDSIGSGEVVPPSGNINDGNYHSYKISWEKDIIEWFLDDELYFKVTRSNGVTISLNTKTGAERTWDGVWPYNDKEYYIIVNLAVGGNFGGPPGTSITFQQEDFIIQKIEVKNSIITRY